jgi:hypothetical protein
MSNNKQTAMQEMIDRLKSLDEKYSNPGLKTAIQIGEQLLEREKETLIDAYDYATMSRVYNDGEDYYNENFTNNEQQ